MAGGIKVIVFLAEYWALQALLARQRTSQRALGPLKAP
jgi:hypothetical protein